MMNGVFKIENEEALQKALHLREEVFVREQNVPKEDEYDEFDKIATHFLAADDAGNALGTARWRKTEKGTKLERFAVRKDWRGKGVGSMLLESVLEDIIYSGNSEGAFLYLHAQVSALSLYEKFGFKKEGDIFEECGIKHYKMVKVL